MSNSNQEYQSNSNEPAEDQLPAYSLIYNGGGNGISGSRANVLQFDLSQRSNVAGIDNLLFRGSAGMKWGTALNQGVNLTFSFSSANSTYTSWATPGSQLSMTATQMTAARQAMQVYSNISNLSFTEVADTSTSAGDIRWGRSSDASVGTAYARFPSNSGPAGDIWFGTKYDDFYQNPALGTYGYQTFLHELGHAMGLMHPHEGSIPTAPGQDQLKYSVMSYHSFDGSSLSFGYTNSFFPSSLMLNDIAAIQYLYGINTGYQSGNNTYSWAANTSVFETIYDSGGIDTIDASNQTQNVLLDLNSGNWSQIGNTFWNGQTYVRDCLTIAYSSTIENATGSAYNDTLIGNAVANVLNGGAGADTLQGKGGDDTYYVDNTGDVVIENANEGTDTVYASINHTLAGNIENLTLTGGAINGTGNSLDNILIGNTYANTLIGGAGNDTLDGGTGSDSLYGGLGDDTYIIDNVGDTVNESAAEGNDTVNASVNFTLNNNIENLTLTGSAIIGTGNKLNNIITGNNLNNSLYGDDGDDILIGGTGADAMYGGRGKDTYYVDNINDTVSEDIASTNYTEYDTVYSSVNFTLSDNVEYLYLTGNATQGKGNSLNNRIFGNELDNIIHGEDGNDQLTGYDGNDIIYGGAGNDLLIGNKGDKTYSDSNTLYGGTGDDRYYITNLNDKVIEYENEGVDWITSFVDLDMSKYQNVETGELFGYATSITGNNLNNTLIGNGINNILSGGAGNDILKSEHGNDIYLFGRGFDRDTIIEAWNADTLTQTDTLQFGSSISADQLWLSKDTNSAYGLSIKIIGTTDEVIISDFLTPVNGRTIEQFKTNDGKTLLANNVDKLINAMAAFSPPTIGQTTLPSNYQQALSPVISAAWT
ncbi:matrixin family metalloprotease [Pseudomonas sp. PDM19]|uniref:matrixin family metalloprotease n=1 Tax=Pseudomonas sp. PDM19 TaxID=2769272 RepID=UPI0017866652|nr:matrixin family metalloprotease [Pseudomonas sp. PDM19]MBD9632517.1 hypothetical protein [Pseudomonas sp. PDM19]